MNGYFSDELEMALVETLYKQRVKQIENFYKDNDEYLNYIEKIYNKITREMIHEYFGNPDGTFYWSNGSLEDIENFVDENGYREWIIDCHGISLCQYRQKLLGKE